ncbi:cytochrome P460 family protein [Zobellella maritima]|uniref:cytochrome P460 family protein n=1 Tax=Zobellella maritima TaxID=2059725 RepID=UPI000E302D67|nr:cytochrome P460 family protein [Zobellella maritima]
MNRIIPGTLLAALMAGPLSAVAADLAEQTYGRYVDQQGGISLPEDARSSWPHLGSWIVEDPEAPGHGFHDVYTQPEAVQGYRDTGAFPDGTILIKEIRSIESGTKTTGQAQWAGEPQIWFVMVKDDKGRFDSPHWDKGWGWALYEAKDPSTNVSKGFAETCQTCHVPAEATGWVFIEGYPTLKN